METYCVRCKKYTANENSSVKRTKQNRLMLLSTYAICSQKKLLNGEQFIPELHLK